MGEAYSVAQKTATILKDPALKTAKADEIINNLSLDQFNVVAKFDGHQVTLNVKLTNRAKRQFHFASILQDNNILKIFHLAE